MATDMGHAVHLCGSLARKCQWSQWEHWCAFVWLWFILIGLCLPNDLPSRVHCPSLSCFFSNDSNKRALLFGTTLCLTPLQQHVLYIRTGNLLFGTEFITQYSCFTRLWAFTIANGLGGEVYFNNTISSTKR